GDRGRRLQAADLRLPTAVWSVSGGRYGRAMVLLDALADAFWSLVVGLFAVGLVSWRRTARLRSGRPPARAVPRRIRTGTSMTTALAGLAGLAAAGWGALFASRNGTLGVAATAGGLLIAASGFRSRVISLAIGDTGLRIGYAGRVPFRVRWNDCRSLSPPVSFLGGWRVRTSGGSVTLMPSDLLGHECILEAIVSRAGMRFDGKRWRRPAGSGSGRPAQRDGPGHLG